VENIFSTRGYYEASEVGEAEALSFNVLTADKTVVPIHGQRIEDTLRLGLSAPFWFCPEILNLDFDSVGSVVRSIIENSVENGIREIWVKTPPSYYATAVDDFEYHLSRENFDVVNTALCQAIRCDAFQSSLVYESSLKSASRRLLRRFSEMHSFQLRDCSLDWEREVADVYKLINNNRSKKAMTLKYSFDYLKELTTRYRERLRLFKFFVDDNYVAAAICHLVGEDKMYVAAWGDFGHALNKSPMYKFCSSLVEYCVDRDIGLLDFGVSSDRSTYTPALIKFKENIGCCSSLQRTYKYASHRISCEVRAQ